MPGQAWIILTRLFPGRLRTPFALRWSLLPTLANRALKLLTWLTSTVEGIIQLQKPKFGHLGKSKQTLAVS
jgi:hypothetical protein